MKTAENEKDPVFEMKLGIIGAGIFGFIIIGLMAWLSILDVWGGHEAEIQPKLTQVWESAGILLPITLLIAYLAYRAMKKEVQHS